MIKILILVLLIAGCTAFTIEIPSRAPEELPKQEFHYTPKKRIIVEPDNITSWHVNYDRENTIRRHNKSVRRPLAMAYERDRHQCNQDRNVV